MRVRKEGGVMETIALIKSTAFEGLVSKYREEQEKYSNSDLNIGRVNIITRQVKTAYNFLCKFGKPHSSMTFDEFEVTDGEIKRIQQDELRINEENLKETPFFRFIKRHSISQTISKSRYILKCGYYPAFYKNTFLGQWTNYREEVPLNLPELVKEICLARWCVSIKPEEINRYNENDSQS